MEQGLFKWGGPTSLRLEFLGDRVCAGAFSALLHIGTSRMCKIRQAVIQDQDGPPMDLRYLKQPKVHCSENKASVVSFLEEVYQYCTTLSSKTTQLYHSRTNIVPH